MTRQELIDYCLTFPGAYEDYPFDDVVDDTATTVMRHSGNKKSFALIMKHDGKLYINLKCDPMEADFLRGAYESVQAGWHMNKQHWKSVIIGKERDVPENELRRQISNSYDLIKPKDKVAPPQKTAVIFIGIPASGKSSFFAKRFKGKYTHINLDALHTRSKEAALLEDCIRDEKSFVVDNTNPTKADRQRYISQAKTAGYRIEGYFFQSVLADCISRNKHRTGKARIPDVAVISISNKLELPSKDEGFDALYFVKLDKHDFIVDDWKDEP